MVTHIPGTEGDPVQTVETKKFLNRVGAELVDMPYETVRRMFSGSSAPDVTPVFDGAIVKREPDDVWSIPILIQNESSRATEHVTVWVEVTNAAACDKIDGLSFQDASSLNPGRRIFTINLTSPIYRGPRTVAGHLMVVMKKGKKFKRVLNLAIQIFSSGMRAREYHMRVQLAKKGFSVKEKSRRFLY